MNVSHKTSSGEAHLNSNTIKVGGQYDPHKHVGGSKAGQVSP